MAGNFDTNETRAAVQTRRPLPRTLLAAVAAVALVTALIIIAVSSARSRGGKKAAELPAPSAAPAATSAPLPTPAPGNAVPAPVTAARAPTDTSPELAVRTALMRDGFPMLRWDIAKFAPDGDGRMRYAGAERTLTGIDVSEHQYDIDWKKVDADGIDFAMIRMGYRGSTAGGLYIDEYFDQNMAGANRAGVPVGVYFYSQAVTVDEAVEEAEFLLEHIREYEVAMPVVFDWEIVGGSEARTYTVSRQDLCECTRAFCDTVAEAGYDPMIYFTQYLGYRKYILRNLSDYAFWYAEYADAPRIAFDFDMWQYSETGKVDGIDGEVDLNILFVR